jgi:hypothetical protein
MPSASAALPKSSHVIMPEKRLILMRFTGAVSLADITQRTEQLWNDALYDPSYCGIVTLERAKVRASIEDVRALIAFLQNTRASSSYWAVVFAEPKATALAMVFKAAWRGSFKLEIVSTWEAACRFLHVDLPAY